MFRDWASTYYLKLEELGFKIKKRFNAHTPTIAMANGFRIIVRGERQVALEEFVCDEGNVEEDSVVVRNFYTMISPGTELSIYTGVDPLVHVSGSWCEYPFRPGYTGVGEVVAKGSNVDDADVGDMVVCNSHHASFDKLSNKTSFWVKEMSNVEPVSALLSHFASIALVSLNVSSVKAGDTVALFGLGLIGQFVAQLLNLIGVQVLAFDPVHGRRRVAEQIGACKKIFDPKQSDPEDEIFAFTGGRGADASVDAVGDSSVILEASKMVRERGEIILLGTPRTPFTVDVTPFFRRVHLNWLTITGALHGGPQRGYFPLKPQTPQSESLVGNVTRCLRLIGEGKLKTRELISCVMLPKNIREAYECLLNRKDTCIGVVLDWTHS